MLKYDQINQHVLQFIYFKKVSKQHTSRMKDGIVLSTELIYSISEKIKQKIL
jgi:hypothetical protein